MSWWPLGGRHAHRSGAENTGTLGNWFTSLVDRFTAEREQQLVSDRALDLYTNDAMSHGLLESLVVEAVGTGMTPLPNPDGSLLGLSPGQVDDFKLKIRQEYKRWGESYFCWADRQRRLNFYGLQALCYFYWRLTGLGFSQVVARPAEHGAPFILSALPLDSWRLATPLQIPGKSKKPDIYSGLELDSSGMAVAGWISPNPVYDAIRPKECTRVPVYDEQTGLPRLLMTYDPRNVAEYRQDSILGCMLKEIRDHKDFVDAVIVKALISNMFVMFLQQTGGYGVDKNTNWEERITDLERGTILQGRENEIPHFFQNKSTPSGLAEMMDSTIKRLGMATGRGPENVSREYKASYSASRASMEKADQFNDYEHSIMGRSFSSPLFGHLVYESGLRGHFPIKSVSKFRSMLDCWSEAKWIPQPVRQIDRKKAAEAESISLSNHTRTLADIYAEQNKDWDTEITQRARELARIKELEDKYQVDMSPVKSAPAEDKGDDDDA